MKRREREITLSAVPAVAPEVRTFTSIFHSSGSQLGLSTNSSGSFFNCRCESGVASAITASSAEVAVVVPADACSGRGLVCFIFSPSPFWPTWINVPDSSKGSGGNWPSSKLGSASNGLVFWNGTWDRGVGLENTGSVIGFGSLHGETWKYREFEKIQTTNSDTTKMTYLKKKKKGQRHAK